MGESERASDWSLFSSHGLVLVCLAGEPDATLRAVSARLGLTERQVGRIVKDLAAAGMVRVERRGRRNTYAVTPEARLRHPALAHVPLDRVIAAVAVPSAGTDRDGPSAEGRRGPRGSG